jgi:hypothetical protein
MDELFMAFSSKLAAPQWLGRRLKDAAAAFLAHEEDSLCRREPLLDEAALEGEKGRPRPGGDPDLRIKALDVVVRGLGRNLELARSFLRGVSRGDQPENLDFAWSQP